MGILVGALFVIGLAVPWLRGSLIVAVMLTLGYLAIGGLLAVDTNPISFMVMVCIIWAPVAFWQFVLRRRPQPMFRPRRLMVGLQAD